jgi:hypothetical protein
MLRNIKSFRNSPSSLKSSAYAELRNFEIARVSGKVWFWFWFVSNQKSRIRNQKFPMGPLGLLFGYCPMAASRQCHQRWISGKK